MKSTSAIEASPSGPRQSRRWVRGLLLLPALLGAVPLPLWATEPPPDPAVDGPRAQTLYQVGQYEEAARLFLRLYELLRSPVLLKNAGKCYLALGDQAERTGELTAARQQWSRAQQVYASYHTSGVSEAEQSEVGAVLASLEAKLTISRPTPPPPASRAELPGRWPTRSTYGWAMASVGVLAAGALFTHYAIDARARDQCEQAGKSGCDETYATDMQLQLAGGIAGLVLAGTGLTLLLTDRDQAATTAPPTSAPTGPQLTLTPWGLGLLVQMRQ